MVGAVIREAESLNLTVIGSQASALRAEVTQAIAEERRSQFGKQRDALLARAVAAIREGKSRTDLEQALQSTKAAKSLPGFEKDPQILSLAAQVESAIDDYDRTRLVIEEVRALTLQGAPEKALKTLGQVRVPSRLLKREYARLSDAVNLMAEFQEMFRAGNYLEASDCHQARRRGGSRVGLNTETPNGNMPPAIGG